MIPTFDTQLVNTAYTYARLMKVRITATKLRKALEEHPDFPALSSLTKTFNRYNVANKAFKVSADQLQRVPTPFLALINRHDQHDDFVIVTDISEITVTYIHDGRNTKTVTREAFTREFRDIIWIAEPNEQSGDPDYEQSVKKEEQRQYKKDALWASLLLLFLIALNANSDVIDHGPFLPLLLLKITGLIICTILLAHIIDKDSPIVKSICQSNTDETTSCDTVLNSKAAKIAGIGLGEVGFTYFAASFLLLLIPNITFPARVFWLAMFNACVVPFILFSLYYQWRVVKQWCRLCLTIQAVLGAELLCFLLSFWPEPYVPMVTLEGGSIVIACIVLPVAAWAALKPVFIKAAQYGGHSQAYRRLKHDPAVFHARLRQQPTIPADADKHGFLIGNPAGDIAVTMISNPYCKPCADAHRRIHNLISRNNNIMVRIIFINENTAGSKGAKAATHIMALARQNEKPEQVITDWYTNMDITSWTAKYPVADADAEVQGTLLQNMHIWCKTNNIAYTPTIYVNGHLLPHGYDTADLERIL